MPSVTGGAWRPEPVRGEPLVAAIPRHAGHTPTPRDAVDEPTHRGTLHAALVTMRPKQWIKNALVVAAAGAAGALGHDDVPVRVAIACVAFCLLASGIYAINDVRDAPEDRLHPRKRHRAVAAGELDPRLATALGIALLLAGVLLCVLVRPLLGLVGLGYVVLTVSYTVALAPHRDPRHRGDRRRVRAARGGRRRRRAGDPLALVRAGRDIGRRAGRGRQALGRAAANREQRAARGRRVLEPGTAPRAYA